MKLKFPKGVYCDVRIEHNFNTIVMFTLEQMNACRVKDYSAAFVRVFDGNRWYYSSTTDIDSLQAEIDRLAALATPNDDIESNKIVQNMSRNKQEKLIFSDSKISNIELADKIALLTSLQPLVKKEELIKHYTLYYSDSYNVKEFVNSKGCEVTHDFQNCGFAVIYSFVDGERRFSDMFTQTSTNFKNLCGFEKDLSDLMAKSKHFMLNSEPVVPGNYTVVLAPVVTGVFTHECFGHKSEADFMDETAQKAWVLGKKMGIPTLSIRESGQSPGSGYVPFDDEGRQAGDNYIIKNGILTGRLHSAQTAATFNEQPTGNARAVNFLHEPIVRMTNTYIDKGDKSVDSLISELKEGIFVENIGHGSGMSTFTLAPTRAYMIKDGKIDKPVRISVISGSVFDALENIDGIGDTVEQFSFVTGGCGKMAQYPLAVGFGGPYIRVKNLTVQ